MLCGRWYLDLCIQKMGLIRCSFCLWNMPDPYAVENGQTWSAANASKRRFLMSNYLYLVIVTGLKMMSAPLLSSATHSSDSWPLAEVLPCMTRSLALSTIAIWKDTFETLTSAPNWAVMSGNVGGQSYGQSLPVECIKPLEIPFLTTILGPSGKNHQFY